MSPMKARVEAAFKRLESKLGIDREGRSVWVWLLPPGIGLVTAAMVLLMPGLSNGVSLPDRLMLAVFGLLVVTTIASIFLISFDNDHNQQALVDAPPDPGNDDGVEVPSIPSGSPRPLRLNARVRATSASVRFQFWQPADTEGEQ